MTMYMDTEIRDKWMAALRSGEYRQGTGALRNSQTGRYCCLGVLCEIAVKEGVIPPSSVEPDDSSTRSFDGAAAMLPMSVIKWAGMRYEGETRPPDDSNLDDFEGSGRYGDGRGDTLVEANDSSRMDFEQIADLIQDEFVAEVKK